MAGRNGKIYVGQDASLTDGTAAAQSAEPSVSQAITTTVKLDFKKIALMMLPTSPISFTGDEAIFAWGRLALYGAVSYMTWGKARKISYAAAGCAGLSLITSLSHGALKG